MHEFRKHTFQKKKKGMEIHWKPFDKVFGQTIETNHLEFQFKYDHDFIGNLMNIFEPLLYV